MALGPCRKKNQKYIHHKYIQVYTNVYYKIYKISTKYQAAAARRSAGPGFRRLAAAWYFVYIILYVFVYV